MAVWIDENAVLVRPAEAALPGVLDAAAVEETIEANHAAVAGDNIDLSAVSPVAHAQHLHAHRAQIGASLLLPFQAALVTAHASFESSRPIKLRLWMGVGP